MEILFVIKIYADSTNDLGPELIAQHNIKTIPLYVTIHCGPATLGLFYIAGEEQ